MSSGILGGILGDMGSGGFGILGGTPAASVPGVPAPQYGTGLLGGLNRMADQNPYAQLQMAAALLDGEGWGAGLKGFAEGAQQDHALRLQRQKQAELEQKRLGYQKFAEEIGHPELANMPDVLDSLALDKYKRREPTEWDRLTQGLSSDELQKAKRYKLGLETKPATTDDMVEYEYSKKDPAFAAFLRSKKGAANAPSGYAYGPDGKLAPIPGGPQDPDRDINEPLPGEIGARFGLANEYFRRFDGIETDLKSKDPRAVGPIDSLGFGQSGAIQRDMKLGSEAMIRMLTGAGMNKEEAENEVKQYLPDPRDSPATVLDKQYRLRSALRSMQREALQGRRSRRQIETEYPAFESPNFEEVQKRVYAGARKPIGQNRASVTAQQAASGKTSSGVTWSAR
ncbi:hypothetical protein [Microvirga lotononidis]|uniref:Uncharacterized protein n=1 Tax=Microvirga lotononidis TaxID=864069 RepID=I4YRQ8_9HYPH|nr:hypothetical protein [Microvirga lotononidis]EIM26650.1 hypothetical protein MicloDRAFT_00031990 [Microvirga lotononidis]WQO32116.1 hypothetical protein U0023_35300 [Microvirga lotononidis]